MGNENACREVGARNQKSGTQNSAKGQAGIEYLMTYGWAIFVIAIVIGLLWIIFAQLKVEQCNMPTGFVCNDPMPQIFSYQGKDYINFKLHNKQAQGLKISKILCTTTSPQDAKESDATDLSLQGITIPAGSSYEFIESNAGQKIACKSGSNALTLAAGQDFRGYVVVWYNYENDLDQTIKRTVSASVAGTILQG